MKAKDLTLGAKVFVPKTNTIETRIVTELGYSGSFPNRKIKIKIGYSSYDDRYEIEPDSEAIIPADTWRDKIYFTIEAAQTKQLRLREDEIQRTLQALQTAARVYAETLAKYKDLPPSDPE